MPLDTPARAPGHRVRSQTQRAKPKSKEEALERINGVAETLPKAQAIALAVILESETPAAEISALTGEPLPSGEEVTAAYRRNLTRGFAARRELLAGALSATQVAALLGVSRQTPHDRLAARTMLAIRDSGQWLFPAWQMDPDGPDGVLPGLPAVLAQLSGPVSDIGRARWFTTPKDHLNGRTPVKALQDGDVDAAIEAAQALGSS